MPASMPIKYTEFRLRYPLYIFHHIPKCGGSSVRQALHQWFHVNDDHYDDITHQAQPPLDLTKFNTSNCICGHFGHEGYMLDQRYPQVFNSFRARKKYRVFCFLRDPLQMRCSLFRHSAMLGNIQPDSLAEGIMLLNNYYARIIGLNKSNYRQKLDKYFFVGIADDLQASFDVLSELIGKPRLELPTINITDREPQTQIDFLTTDQILRFKQANKLDYQIFEYALERLKTLNPHIRSPEH